MTAYKQTQLKFKLWTDTHGRRFEVLGTYTPNEQIVEEDDEDAPKPDVWIEYRNQTTGDTYNCRLEAFTSRFHPIPD
jgi:hypothetical protein